MTDGGFRDGSGGPLPGAIAAAPADGTTQVGAETGTDAAGPVRGLGQIIVAGALALLFLAAAWFAVRRGIVTDTWPAFLPGTDSTAITRYSGPWLTAAAAAVLGAALCVLALVRGLTTRSAR